MLSFFLCAKRRSWGRFLGKSGRCCGLANETGKWRDGDGAWDMQAVAELTADLDEAEQAGVRCILRVASIW